MHLGICYFWSAIEGLGLKQAPSCPAFALQDLADLAGGISAVFASSNRRIWSCHSHSGQRKLKMVARVIRHPGFAALDFMVIFD